MMGRGGGLINFLPLKRRGGAYWREGSYLRGGGLSRVFTVFTVNKLNIHVKHFIDKPIRLESETNLIKRLDVVAFT